MDCPFCASDDLAVIVVTIEYDPVVLAVKCMECGAIGPSSHSPEPEHAIFAWNQRYGGLSIGARNATANSVRLDR